MRHLVSKFALGISTLITAMVVVGPLTASANHSWNNYHWARTANPFTVQLGDNVSSAWDGYLATANTDWSASSVLDTRVVAGQSNPKNCRATSGRVEVCNSAYGKNGWLGVAQIWISGEHIVQGTVRLNDTYFKTPTYNSPAWRNLVMCQEIGHTLGLAHQDENFTNANLNSCMDYTSSPATNQHPNQHDYDQLVAIYTHLDSTSTIAALPAAIAQGDFDAPKEWGKLVKESANGRYAVYERELPGRHKVVTFVVRAL